MALILLRHFEPQVDPGVCYGRSDVAARAATAADLSRLLAALPRGIARVESSPLIRCRALAEALADRLGLPLAFDERLAEIDFGRWEMRCWDDIPRAEIDAWAADVTGARPHGGESVADMIERVRGFLAERSGGTESVLAVTHLGVVRCVRAILGQEGAFVHRLGHGAFEQVDLAGLA
ncbi:histidine phosphatase family protein [Erythrobacter sp. HL-111]|uniref:histidine phosphatase family protein n=1 Tax=Erythrobacter sp. HL-111 TaxID=1798193 RepID=UPI0006D9B160|nr:histidine phosphatase family protein [Erythrobacter sp. HL-111]KPP94430.1 MAG: alpha-ribazole phosphatase CobC2 [Erythrobacteraceae bacterium HL-111]SDS56478.1 alpha-ribazole phosphatase [Erythrobacter sp. HL-111]